MGFAVLGLGKSTTSAASATPPSLSRWLTNATIRSSSSDVILSASGPISSVSELTGVMLSGGALNISKSSPRSGHGSDVRESARAANGGPSCLTWGIKVAFRGVGVILSDAFVRTPYHNFMVSFWESLESG